MNPLVTIGVPVWNGEATLATCLDSVLSQSYSNIEVFVADNCSTDSTPIICDHYALLDDRVIVIHRETHVSAGLNFSALLSLGHGEFFMWAASDDKWSQDFVERCLDFLLSNPSYVACITPAIKGSVTDPSIVGTLPCDHSSAAVRVNTLIKCCGSNARFYSLYRRSVLLETHFERFTWVAGDWSFVLTIAERGKLGLCNGSIGFFKSKGGLSSNFPKMCESSAVTFLEILFPYSRFSYHAITSFPLDIGSILFLVRLNLAGLRKYALDKSLALIYPIVLGIKSKIKP